MVTAAVAAVTLNKPFDNNIYFGMITYTTISYNDIYDGPKPELADQNEFYQLLEYTDDIDIAGKLKEWEDFYNYHRPNFALKGKTPYEVLREKLTPK